MTHSRFKDREQSLLGEALDLWAGVGQNPNFEAEVRKFEVWGILATDWFSYDNPLFRWGS